MPSPIVLIPLVATAAAISIDDVRPVLEDGELRVEIVTLEEVAARDVRTRPERDRLVLYVAGGRTVGGRTSFGADEPRVRVYPRALYAKIEVAFPTGHSCSGPVTIETEPRVVRARMSCRAEPATAAAVAQVAPPPHTEPVAVLSPAPAAATPAPSVPALAPAPPARDERAALPPPALPPQEAAAAAPTALAPGALPGLPASAAAPAAAFNAAPARDADAGAGLGPIAAALGLVALGAVALVMGRRRARRPRVIEIVESTSLGPRRSLIVARINGETLILGASEAGISRLASVDRAPVSAISDEPPEGQQGLLARLFSKPARIDTEAEAQARAAVEAEEARVFDEMLHESIEDQDLRHRLAAGQTGTVS